MKNRTEVFDPEPPELASEVEELFFDRVEELAWAAEKLAARSSNLIYSIQGARRSGKSHFARRLLQVAEKEHHLPLQHVVINAHNHGTARGVLRETYFQFQQLLEGITLTDKNELSVRAEFFAQHRLVNLDRVTFSTESQTKSGVGGELASSTTVGVPNVAAVSVGAKGSVQVEDAGRRTETFVGLSDPDIVRWIGRAADLLYLRRREREVALLFDDLDLVDFEGREGAAPSNELLELLRPLAAHPHVRVIATVRHDYADGRKNVFSRLAELGPMDEDTLQHVYKLRIKRFFDGDDVFDAAALQSLLESADGMVGVFLRNCERVLERAGSKAKYPLSSEAIDAYAKWQLDVWRTEEDYVPVIASIESQLRGKRPKADILLDGDLSRTALHLTLVRAVVGRPNVWAINPLFLGAIQRKR